MTKPLLETAIKQVAEHLKTTEADVLLIAGDLFDGGESRAQIQASIAFLKETFTPFLAGGGTILAISGNHDSEHFFLTLRDAFDLVAPRKEDADGVQASGRFYIAPNGRVVRLRGKSGQVVQFVLMPFPTPRAYLYENYREAADKNAAMAAVYHRTLNGLN